MTNMPFKVLLCGGSGMLGQELLHSIPDGIDVWAPSSTELDIRYKEVVLQKAAMYQPDLIINTAAYTNVDGAETNEALAFSINRDGPENLGIYAAQASIPVFHISTDYVFDGTKGEPYTEEDEPNPINVYGKSKLAGEYALQQVCEQSLILRTSWLFSDKGENFCGRILKAAMQQSQINVVSDQFGTPSSALHVAGVLWSITESYIRNRRTGFWGVFNCSEEPEECRYSFAKKIIEQAKRYGMVKMRIVVNPVETGSLNSVVKRPAMSSLDNSKIRNCFSINRSLWLDSLDFLLKNGK